MKDRTCSVLVFLSCTMAPGTGLPLASVTTPLTDFSSGALFFFWPNANVASANTNSTTVAFLNICHQLKPRGHAATAALFERHGVKPTTPPAVAPESQCRPETGSPSATLLPAKAGCPHARSTAHNRTHTCAASR